eukprot:scaffold35017_cov49-Attheya_sp.AAC.1
MGFWGKKKKKKEAAIHKRNGDQQQSGGGGVVEDEPVVTAANNARRSPDTYLMALEEYKNTIPHNASSSVDEGTGNFMYSPRFSPVRQQQIRKRINIKPIKGESSAKRKTPESIPSPNNHNHNHNNNAHNDMDILSASSSLEQLDSRDSIEVGMSGHMKYHGGSEYGGASSIGMAASVSFDDTATHRPYQEPEMPDTTYDEYYGDAYVGGSIKYIYPSGYQSMRPRGGPWKLSMVVCALFTWLTIFIVGHCADGVEYSNENDDAVNDDYMDDDAYVIATRWCGSRPLYFMWIISALITGLSGAYCSIIGYIKVRDFAVANCRSQPPGMVGKSDYYVRLED